MAFIIEPAWRAVIKQATDNQVTLSADGPESNRILDWSFSMPCQGGEVTAYQNGEVYAPHLDWWGNKILAYDIDDLLGVAAEEWKKVCKHEGIVAEWTTQKLDGLVSPIRYSGRTRVQKPPPEQKADPAVVIVIILFFTIPFVLGLMGINM